MADDLCYAPAGCAPMAFFRASAGLIIAGRLSSHPGFVSGGKAINADVHKRSARPGAAPR